MDDILYTKNPKDATRKQLESFIEFGKVTVLNPRFEEIVIKIYVNGQEDTCIVRLKEYPTDIYLTDDTMLTEKSDFINAGGVYSIHVYGNFSDGIREIGDDKYNFLVETSDPTVLDVMDNTRLKVCTLKHKIESATITIKLLDTTGKVKAERYVLTLKLTVVVSPNSSYIKLEGCDSFIEEGDVVNIDATENNFETEKIANSTYYHLGYTIELFNAAGIYIDSDEYTVTCITTEQNFVVIDNENQILKLRRKSNTNVLSIVVTIATSTNISTGDAYATSFTLNFTFPE